MPKISPFLWFDGQAEEAARFYVSIFPRSRIVKVARYGEAGPGPAGSVMTVQFELDGQEIIALNGGPHFRFTEAISLAIDCKNQDEVDHFWSKLTEGGEESQCGWLKDRFGLSWQVTPTVLTELTADPDPVRARKAMAAMMTMKKIDIAALLEAVGDRPQR
jgi:predicted 3-demethylubiquinone-9 3-methyltransferase (glyoxalase superfamily)